MGIKKLIIVLFLFCCGNYGYSVEFSDSLQASVLTVSPGDELYSTFGHTAIRITDLHNGFDFVFNYLIVFSDSFVS